MSDTTQVTAFPPCDICTHVHGLGDLANPAKYDGKTTSGPWANMCDYCFRSHGVGLGTGRGQRLVLTTCSGDKPGGAECDCPMAHTATPDPHPGWVAGWNMPGYSPDPDNVTAFDTWEEARDYLVETIDRFWDSDAGYAPDSPLTTADDRWLEIHTQMPLQTRNETVMLTNGDMSLAFWILDATPKGI